MVCYVKSKTRYTRLRERLEFPVNHGHTKGTIGCPLFYIRSGLIFDVDIIPIEVAEERIIKTAIKESIEL